MLPAAAAAAAAADHPMLSLSSFLKKSRVGQEAPCFSYFIQLLYIQKRQWIQNRAIQKNETIAHFNEHHTFFCLAAMQP